MANCPKCGSGNVVEHNKWEDDQAGFVEGFLRCDSCGNVFDENKGASGRKLAAVTEPEVPDPVEDRKAGAAAAEVAAASQEEALAAYEAQKAEDEDKEDETKRSARTSRTNKA